MIAEKCVTKRNYNFYECVEWNVVDMPQMSPHRIE